MLVKIKFDPNFFPSHIAVIWCALEEKLLAKMFNNAYTSVCARLLKCKILVSGNKAVNIHIRSKIITADG